MKRKRHSAKVKAAIIARQGGLCARSGVPLAGRRVEYNHVIPLALGGADHPDNLEAITAEAHRELTSQHMGQIAKAKRCEKKLTRAAIRKPKKAWPTRNLAGRSFPDNLTRKFNRTVIPRAPRAAQS